MLKSRIMTGVVMTAVFSLTIGVAQAEGKPGPWEKIYQKDGITVHKRSVEGSSIVEFRGRGILYSNLVRCLAVLADTDHSHEWIDRNLGVKILKVINEKERIYYSAVDAPWPFKARDFVAHSKFIVDEDSGWIHIKSNSVSNPYKAPGTDRVRMPFTNVRWSFKPLAENKVWLEFRAHADPGGNIPDWLVNLVSKELPYKTIQNFRARVTSNKVSQKFIDQYKEYSTWGYTKKEDAAVKKEESGKTAETKEKSDKKKKKKKKKGG